MDKQTAPVADAAMDAKMREIWARFQKPWIRNNLRDMLPPTPVECLGTKFIVHPRDNFTEFKMWENALPPEHEATEALAARFAGKDVTIVDVGANAGAFFLPILNRAGKMSKALVFEPNPVMRARLLTNIDLNKLAKRVTVFDCAVSDEAGQSRLHFPRNGNLGQGRVEVAYEKGTDEDGVDVALRTLPDCLKEAGITQVDFLKVDVEGLEDRVIVPLLDDESAPRPALVYFEIAHDGVWKHPLTDRLEEDGYVRIETYGQNALFELKTPLE